VTVHLLSLNGGDSAAFGSHENKMKTSEPLGDITFAHVCMVSIYCVT